jgi:hypothetical protein
MAECDIYCRRINKEDYITMSQALDILRSRFGYPQFRFQQQQIIDALISGQRTGCAGFNANRGRQIAVLPDPGNGTRRCRHYYFPADRADAGPG